MAETERQEEQPILSIVGGKVALGPHRRELLPLYLKWMNDFEVSAMHGGPLRPVTAEVADAWYADPHGPERRVEFTIYERSTLRPVGLTSLHDFDHSSRSAGYAIAIGERDCWGKGYGTEVTRLMLRHGFAALGLHSIWLRVYAFNERGIRAYARAGFKVAGRLREGYRLGSRFHDVVYMDCLSTDFEDAPA